MRLSRRTALRGAAASAATALSGWLPALPAIAAGVPGVTDAEIVLGGVFALTGPVRLITEPYEQGARAYFDRVNKAGGVHGRRIRWLVEDDAYTPAKALAGAKKLVDRDGVAFLFGQLGTQTTLAIAPYAEQAKVPFFSASPAPAQQRTYTFGLMADYTDEMYEIVRHLVSKGGKARIGYLFQNDDLGEVGRRGIDKALAEAGLKLAAAVGFERGTSDYGTQILAMRDANPDAVIVMATAPAIAAAIKQAGGMGFAPLWATYGVGSSNIMQQLLGPSIEGLLYATELQDQYSDTPEAKELASDLKALHPDAKPDYATFLGYAHARVIVDLLRAVGPAVSREAVMRVAGGDAAFEAAVMAPVRYGRTRAGATGVRILQWRDGRPQPLTGWIDIRR